LLARAVVHAQLPEPVGWTHVRSTRSQVASAPDVALRNLDNEYARIATKRLVANHYCRLGSPRRITTDDGGNIYVLVDCRYPDGYSGPRDQPLLDLGFMVSRDGGQTFGPAAKLDGMWPILDVRGGAPGEAYAIGVRPDKSVGFSRTEDAGATWSPAIEILPAFNLRPGPDALLAVIGKHVIVAATTRPPKDEFKISHDGGRTFTRVEGPSTYDTQMSVQPEGTIWVYSFYPTGKILRSTDDAGVDDGAWKQRETDGHAGGGAAADIKHR
jgi:hypothetical protein